MGNHFPDIGSGVVHLSALTYFAQVTGLKVPGTVQVVRPSGSFQTGFLFDTGTITPDPDLDLQELTWDYSWFDEDQTDQEFLQLVEGFAQFVAQSFSLSIEDVRAAITAQRIWAVEPNYTGSEAPYQLPGLTIFPQIVETIPYPAALDSDTGHGEDGGENIVRQ